MARRDGKWSRAGILAAAMSIAFVSMARAATPDEVDAAIKRGVDWLYSRPEYKANGNWEPVQKRDPDKAQGHLQTGAQWGGRTALITYALLASGQSPNDPRLKPAIDFLKKSDDMIGYYALGLRPQVWLYLPQTDQTRQLATRDFRLLWAGIEKDMGKRDGGLYDYTLGYDRDQIDLSVSQYGVLGMWACAQLGVEVPGGDPRRPQGNYWQMVEMKWRALQDKAKGGWAYRGDSSITPSMTAAGVATLFITQDYLRSSSGVNCQGNQRSPEIEKGVDYLAEHFPSLLADGNVPDRHYTLYGIERIGVASGLKYLNNVDWYQAGADFLVRTQAKNGSWEGQEADEIPTSFSLLFLARGREPVMMNKLKYDIIGPSKDKPLEGFWNQRSRDVANATRFVGRQTERALNWQILDMNLAGAADLRDAPIAYMSGSQTFNLAPEQIARLKQYIEEGGMLVFNPDCARRQFSTSAIKLMKEMFPDYEFRPLPETHPVFRNQQFRSENWKRKQSIQGLSNDVRELAIILDGDQGKSFQTNDFGRQSEHFELITDIYQYAIDKKNSLVKGRSYVRDIDPSVRTTGEVKLARIQYKGRWNPEPGGWKQMAATLHNDHKTELKMHVIDLERDELTGYHAAHLTGTRTMTLSKAAISKLKAFVEAGGLVIVDAAGGNGEFATAIEAQLGDIVAAAKEGGGALIPPGDAVYTINNLPAPQFRYRTFTQATVGLSNAPRIRGSKVGERYALIYSPDDLSAGLVGNEVDGVRGYTPAAASEIMSRLLLYARAAPTGKAATRPTTAPTPAKP